MFGLVATASKIKDGNNKIEDNRHNLYFMLLSKQDYYVYAKTISYIDNQHLYNFHIGHEHKAKAMTMKTKLKFSKTKTEKEVKDNSTIDIGKQSSRYH